LVACLFSTVFLPAPSSAQEQKATTMRVACYDLGGVRTRDLLRSDARRVKALAEIIQRVRPNILVVSGIDRDDEGAPDVPPNAPPGLNASRFVDRYLAVPQAKGLIPLNYETFMPVTNSGQPSGMDLDHSGSIESAWVDPAEGATATAQENAARARYSGDCWGPGAYPGQRGIAVLVDPRLSIDRASIRTIRLMPWDYMPASSLAMDDRTGKPAWYTPEEAKTIRLASTCLVDVPVKVPNGSVLHVISTLPTEIGGHDEQQRRARRNRDEIRLLTDYIEGQGYIVDDAGRGGGLEPGASFVVLANLNATPGDPAGYRDPIAHDLFISPRLNASVTPDREHLDWVLTSRDSRGDDASKAKRGSVNGPRAATTRDGRRVDYVLPSKDLGIRDAGVWSYADLDANGKAIAPPSDHDLVLMDLWVRPPAILPPPAATESKPGEVAPGAR
jgi:hypothetical protein